MTSVATQIADNVADIRRRITAACGRAGRAADDVRLVAVTKSAEIDWIRQLVALGEVDLGESRPQQLFDREAAVGAGVRWHLIGSLQRNKVRRVLPLVQLIHSVDSLRLLDAVDRVAGELALRARVLLEVNVSGEEAKHGFSPKELSDCAASLSQFSHVDIAGLMTMAPFSDDPESARPVFRGLRTFRDELRGANLPLNLDELSMGMSNDFEVAVEEGATFVRVGSDLFRGLDVGADG